MSTLRIFRGVPGSGKSTEAEKYSSTDKAIRLNRDDLRKSAFGRYWGMDEGLVTKLFDGALDAALKTGVDVISDNTNLVNKHVMLQVSKAQAHGYAVEVHDFPITRNEAVARDAAREKQVGYKVIDGFFKRFVGKDGFSLRPVPDFEQVTFEPVGPRIDFARDVAIVDIDGTLAHHEGVRGPYDTSRYHLDEPDAIIAYIATAFRDDYSSNKIIIMSGRDEAFREVTENWLSDKLAWRKGEHYIDLFMRPEGDRRNDAVVKNELYEKHIRGKYNVDFVLDDRDRVVHMWRAKGLKCLQVAPGDF